MSLQILKPLFTISDKTLVKSFDYQQISEKLNNFFCGFSMNFSCRILHIFWLLKLRICRNCYYHYSTSFEFFTPGVIGSIHKSKSDSKSLQLSRTLLVSTVLDSFNSLLDPPVTFPRFSGLF